MAWGWLANFGKVLAVAEAGLLLSGLGVFQLHLTIQRGENPCLEDATRVGLHFAEDDSEAGSPDIKYFRRTFEELIGMPNLDAHTMGALRQGSSLEEATAEA